MRTSYRNGWNKTNYGFHNGNIFNKTDHHRNFNSQEKK